MMRCSRYLLTNSVIGKHSELYIMAWSTYLSLSDHPFDIEHASKSYLFTHARPQILLSVLLFKQDPNLFRSFGFSPDLTYSKRSAVLAWTLFERFGLSLMPLWMMARNKVKQRQEFQAGACLSLSKTSMSTGADLKEQPVHRCVRDLPRIRSFTYIIPQAP